MRIERPDSREEYRGFDVQRPRVCCQSGMGEEHIFREKPLSIVSRDLFLSHSRMSVDETKAVPEVEQKRTPLMKSEKRHGRICDISSSLKHRVQAPYHGVIFKSYLT